MTPNEALELLGLSEGADPRAIKRAYHQRLKHTKPDRDPQGFQRLREAFELATAYSQGEALFALPSAVPSNDDGAEASSSPLSPEPSTPTPAEVVQHALDRGRVEEAIDSVLAPEWADVLIDDLDGSATWVTSSVAKVAILARPSAFDVLQSRYPDLVEGTDVEMGLLLRVRRDWEHLLAHCDLPPPLFDIIVQNPVASSPERRRSLGHAVGRWYWQDPATAWQVLTATLSNHGALGPYVLGVLEAYEDLAEQPATVPIEVDATPREVLRPLTVPFVILAFAVGTTVLIAAMPEEASDTTILGIVLRHIGGLLAGVVALALEVFAYRMWPSIRRRFLHACLVHDLLPEDAAWGVSGHVFLQRAIANDLLLLLCHRVSRLNPPEQAFEDD